MEFKKILSSGLQICLEVFEIRLMRVTWPMPRPFSRFFFASFWDIATLHLCTKFQVSISPRFGDTLGCTPKFLGVTRPTPRPYSGFFLRFLRYCPLEFVYKISSLYLYSFWIYVRATPKILGVTWRRPRTFPEFFFAGFWDIAPVHLPTKFHVSSSSLFGDMLVCTPKFMGSRHLGHATFLDFSSAVFEILPLCICVPNLKSLALRVL